MNNTGNTIIIFEMDQQIFVLYNENQSEVCENTKYVCTSVSECERNEMRCESENTKITKTEKMKEKKQNFFVAVDVCLSNVAN